MTTILLVDDQPLQRKVSRLFLEDAGYLVETAADAEEALVRVRAVRPDVILSDVVMGALDGFGLCRRLQQDATLDQVPVVLVSSHYGRADVDLAKEVGAATLVERSSDFTAELDAVRACLGQTPSRVRRTISISAASYEHHLRASAAQLTQISAQARRVDERYRTLLDHANDVISILTPEGVVLEVNHRWEDVLGIPAAQMIGKHAHDFAPHGKEAELADAYRLAVDQGGMRQLVPLKHATGRTVFVELSSSVVDVDGTSEVLAIGRDVTDELAARHKLVAAEAMYRELVERIPDVVWRCRGSDGTFLFISQNVENLTGVTAIEVYASGRAAFGDRVVPEDLEAFRKAYQQAVATGTPHEVEYRLRRPDGRIVWLHSRIHPVVVDGEVILEGLTADVTSRRQLERGLAQSQKLEAIGQLTGGIAHDFNNILSVILSNASFLLEDIAINDPRRNDVEEIRAMSEKAAALTRQLLTFSRPTKGERGVIDVAPALTGIEKMLRRVIGADIAMTLRIAPDLGEIVGDTGQIEQVVMNLVVNARDAMPRGGAIAISATNIEIGPNDARGLSPGGYIALAVRDTGTGMSPEVRQRIFEPFFTTKERGKGTGLGLWTCYGIAQQLGGHIGVESELGTGTTFELLIPRAEPLNTSDR